MTYVPADLRRAGFTPANVIAQGNRVTAGKVNIRGTFTYNTKFPQEWSRDPRTIRIWQELVDSAVSTAERLVPVDSGRLRDSIRGRVENTRTGGTIRGVISAGGDAAPYWAFVEYGTGMRGQGSPQPEPGRPVGWRNSRGFAGQSAQPYLRPALMQLRSKARNLKGAR